MINVLNRALLYKDTNSEATAKVWSALRKEGIEYAVDTKVNSAVTGKNKGHLITNNASIGLLPPLHHIYNFGDVSMFIGMGSPIKEAMVDSEGKTRMKRWLPLGLTADERVCSGAHYAKFFADATKFFSNPELMEQPPEEVFFDEGVEYHVPKVRGLTDRP